MVTVKLDFGEERVHLTVRDDGKGFDPKKTPRGHYGLLNMRERAMKLGGEIIVDSSPGAGALGVLLSSLQPHVMTGDPVDPQPTTPTPPIRVFVVEDQTKILKNQLRLLEGHPDIEIIGTALSGEAALEEVPKLMPDVLLLDLGLPRMSGIDVTRVVKASLPEGGDPHLHDLRRGGQSPRGREGRRVRLPAQGRHGGQDHRGHQGSARRRHGHPAEPGAPAAAALPGGAGRRPRARGARPLPHPRPQSRPCSTRSPPPRWSRAPREARQDEPQLKPLSDREKEILQLIAKGVSNSEAAKLLNLSKATIRTHLEHIYRKLEVTNRVEAVTEGIRKGLISV